MTKISDQPISKPVFSSDKSPLFSLENFRGDFFGGLTAGIVALPLALAFGEQTELGAIAGLYGAIALAIFAALFGGTRTQISGPTAPMTVVSALIIADALKYAGSLEAALPTIVATFLLAGLIQVLFGLMRMGGYIKYIPYPVVSGFMSGIGVIIIITQIFPLLGVSAPAGGPMGTIREIRKIPEIVNFPSLALASLTIAIIYIFPKLSRKIPSTLVALVLVSTLAYFFIPAESILRINSAGAIPGGLPALHLELLSIFSDFAHLLLIFEYAFTLAALGAIDSLLTSVVADNMTKTKHDSNQELIGQGVGNMVAALIAGLPGAGATMRTVININAGGRTKLSGVVAGCFLLLVLLGLGQLVGQIPNAVLAGILIVVGIGIIDYRGITHARKMPKADALVMFAVLFLTVFVDLLIAVGAGMVLSALLFMKKVSDEIEAHTYSKSLVEFSREDPWLDEAELDESVGQNIYIKHLEGPLFFGFASKFQELVQSLPDVKVLIIRMDRVPHIDQSGLYALEEGLIQLQKQGIEVALVHLRTQPRDMLESIHIVPDLIPEEQIFETFHDCVLWLDKIFANKVLGGNIRVQNRDSQSSMTPEKALDYLKRGNKRFRKGTPLRRDFMGQVGETQDAQYPFAAIVSCIDSRAPVNQLFDQGIGDLFNARIAGNFVNQDIVGSLEFSCKVAGAKLIVILGHTSCGAIKGACDGVELGNLTQLLKKIEPAIGLVKLAPGEVASSKNSEFVDRVAEKNVQRAIADIRRMSPILTEMETRGEIVIAGAMYNVANGSVQFFEESLGQ